VRAVSSEPWTLNPKLQVRQTCVRAVSSEPWTLNPKLQVRQTCVRAVSTVIYNEDEEFLPKLRLLLKDEDTQV
jgi:hypothetical protein